LLNVIFRCDDFWVLNKPVGMSFHAESDESGVMKTLKQDYPSMTFYPVHRLDKMTSGILLVALNKEAAAKFGELFERHQIEKRYIALSDRKPKKKQGSIKGGMVPSRRGQWRLTTENDNLAVTQFFSTSFDGFRAFIVRPLTGKTHQIRVALKSLGSPIFGDDRYSGTPADRGYLHAYSVSFEWAGELKSYCVMPSSGEHFNAKFCDFVRAHFAEKFLKWPSGK